MSDQIWTGEKMKKSLTDDELWELLQTYQGHPFFTAKNLEFTYTIKGGEMFVDRRSKSITRATLCKAYHRIEGDAEHQIGGPKALNCFGAPYIWAIFAALGLAKPGTPRKGGRPRRVVLENGHMAECYPAPEGSDGIYCYQMTMELGEKT